MELRARAGFAEAACLHAAHYVEEAGEEAGSVRVAIGAGAINAVLRRAQGRGRAAWRLLALAYGLWCVRHAQDLGYRLVAANRHRVGDDACAVGPVPGKP